ncbi:hypothetical protein TrST_g7633 [Triparma strigata]|uniref:Uncharacterized protein n=1 Tax=Triparma strigata TaxID=1606541 RepID=A0A9W7AQG0_9STRA|nr:hypothetical protein TrST_g7633 [Triparma strigata]
MTKGAKKRKGSVENDIFKKMVDQHQHIDQITSVLPLTYQLNNMEGTTNIPAYDSIEIMIKTVIVQHFGDIEGVPGSPLHQLCKFSPERLDNGNPKYSVSNTIPVACAFQTVDGKRTKDTVLEQRKKDQKWTSDTFKKTDFCLMTKVFKFVPPCDNFNEKYNDAVDGVLKGIRKLVTEKKEDVEVGVEKVVVGV